MSSPQLGDFKAHVHKLRLINLVKFLLKHYLMSLESAVKHFWLI